MMSYRKSKVASAFGVVLRRTRRATGLTQAELAEKADTHPNTISILERGHSGPGLDVVINLSQALDVAPDALVRKTMDELDT